MADMDPEILYVSSLVAAIFRSPTWASPIAKFVDDNCYVFEDLEENKLEYTLVHSAFKQLVDELLEAHLEELEVSQEQFTRFCQHGMTGDNEFHQELVEELLSVDDFLIFKAMMVKRSAQLHRQAFETFGGFVPSESYADQGAAQEEAERLATQQRLVEAAELEAEKLDLQQRCVEAELQLVMALSMQLQRRLQLMEALTEVLEALAEVRTGAEEALAAEAAAEKPVQVQPLHVVQDPALGMMIANAEPPDPRAAEAEAQQQRERAQQAMAASRRTAAAREHEARASTAAPPQPTDDERRRRAEHMKRHRDLLLQKRNQEREQQFNEFKQSRGPSAAVRVADKSLGEQRGPSDAGKRLAAELSGRTAASAQNPSIAAQAGPAAEMRKVLTQQLKQTFLSP